MKANILRTIVLKPIVELLVLAEIKTLLLQLPLQIPIGLSNEKETWMLLLNCPDHVDPVLGGRPLTRAAAPRSLEDRIQQKHRHIAADAIALTRDI